METAEHNIGEPAENEELVETLVVSPLLEDASLHELAERLGYVYQKTLNPRLSTIDVTKTPINYLKKNLLAPLSLEEGLLTIATSDPLRRDEIDDIRRLLGARRTETVLSPPREIIRVLNQIFDQAHHSSDRFIQDLDEADEDRLPEDWNEVEDLMDSTSEAPIIRLVNYTIAQAVKNRASDIHIEPYQDELRVRYRIDGILYDYLSPPKRTHSAIVSRVKVMSNLNIAEKRLPQDGRVQIKIGGREIDIRVSIIPTFHGERIVLRLLDKRGGFLTLEELGFSEQRREVIDRIIHYPHGIVLVTGPTGSGKTTSLYAALSSINSSDKNIITVEDPIEYQLKGVGQIQVSPKIGLTFASGLRSILRHDPDVIMVGEIRDLETVQMAIQASLTGHLVFSTLHTNDAVGAMTRLVDMGVEPFLITSSLIAVIAQRLARSVCPHCSEKYQPPSAILQQIGLDLATTDGKQLVRGRGCDKCFNTGYRGRTGIFEILIVDDELRREILSGADSVTIGKMARDKGLVTLRDDGIQKALAGLTTLEEVLRVTQG